jgi:cobalt/nickel transport protein
MKQFSKSSLKKTNLILLLLVVLISAFPLFFHPSGSEFGGSDDQGPALIEQEHPDYKVWFSPVWEPPSGEIESLFFALQAAIGAGVVGYALGYLKGKNQTTPTENIKPDEVITS